MISHGAIGCSSLFGANFLDCLHCGLWLRPSTQMPVIAFGRGAGFVRLCLVTFHQEEHSTMTQTTISWLLLVIELIEKRGCVWYLGVANKYMWRGHIRDWQWPCGRKSTYVRLTVSAFPCVYASGFVCGIILENLSL